MVQAPLRPLFAVWNMLPEQRPATCIVASGKRTYRSVALIGLKDADIPSLRFV